MQYMIPVPSLSEKESINLEGFKPKNIDPNDISIEVEKYFQSYSPQTVKAYRADLHSFWLAINKPLQKTTNSDILSYIKRMEHDGLSNATINRRLASLSKILSIYIAMGLINHNPVQTLAALGKLYKSVDPSVSLNITKHDVEAVVANARKKTSVIVQFLVNTGVRVSELTNIKKDEIEPYDSSWLRIKLTKTKGGKIRFVFISYELFQKIKDAFDEDSIYLFSSASGKILSRINIYKQVKRAFQKHALREGVHPHTLRHYFATTKIRDEKKKDYKAVSSYLGHSSVSTTLDIYTTSQLSPEETIII